jgi:asparagine synthase (glutamine-hydrolysing)
VANAFDGDPEQAVDMLETLLKDAIKQQMIADVPLGTFLSGGVDSSTVVALMQAQSSRPVKTFSIGFHEKAFNEAECAKSVARHLGTEHTELYVTADEALAVIPRLPAMYDEPFADSSQIPTFLVSHMARQHVSVALSGDGGDELFCGYSRYQMATNLWRYLVAVPLPVRKLAARGLISVPVHSWNMLAGMAGGRYPYMGDKLHKGAGVLASRSFDAFYSALSSYWHDPASAVIGAQEPTSHPGRGFPSAKGLDNITRMMALDMVNYLPDDIMVKVDRAAMSVSLETRAPFLDHRVVEFAWRLPQSVKLRDGQSKWVLRQVLYRHVPKELIERPKKGFAVPLGEWLRGPLRDWAESLLDESLLRNQGFIKPELIRNLWSEHLSGERDWKYRLWNVLMFQAWLQRG